MNSELKKLANWFMCNKMAVNTLKTKFIIFRTKGKKIPNDISIVFNCNEIGKEENPSLLFKLERIHGTKPLMKATEVTSYSVFTCMNF
jgi:hypothetical protein